MRKIGTVVLASFLRMVFLGVYFSQYIPSFYRPFFYMALGMVSCIELAWANDKYEETKTTSQDETAWIFVNWFTFGIIYWIPTLLKGCKTFCIWVYKPISTFKNLPK